jgi:hypothetical protein
MDNSGGRHAQSLFLVSGMFADDGILSFSGFPSRSVLLQTCRSSSNSFNARHRVLVIGQEKQRAPSLQH